VSLKALWMRTASSPLVENSAFSSTWVSCVEEDGFAVFLAAGEGGPVQDARTTHSAAARDLAAYYTDHASHANRCPR
jgi:hypothetical protein